MPDDAQGLFLALCLGVIPSSNGGTEDLTRASCLQDKCLNILMGSVICIH